MRVPLQNIKMRHTDKKKKRYDGEEIIVLIIIIVIIIINASFSVFFLRHLKKKKTFCFVTLMIYVYQLTLSRFFVCVGVSIVSKIYVRLFAAILLMSAA